MTFWCMCSPGLEQQGAVQLHQLAQAQLPEDRRLITPGVLAQAPLAVCL